MNSITVSARYFHRWLAPTLRALKSKKDKLPARADPRKSFVEWNYDAELYAFGQRLGENFNRDVLRRALTEQSYLEREESKQKDVGMEPEIQLVSNADLVSTGHRLIENYVIRYLTASLPSLPHPYILNIKNYLISEQMLAHISKNVGIDDILLVPQDFPDESSLCRGFKAVVSAIEDTSRSERLVRDLVVSQLCGFDLTKLTTPENPVEELEKIFAETDRSEPEFRLISESGVNTLLPVFHVGVYSDKEFVGRGFGESISIAKEMAACDVLWRLWGVSRRKPFPMDLEPPKRALSSSIDITTSHHHS